MITAFVSISVTPGSDEEIIRELVKDKRVKEAWLTMGEYDILLIIQADDADEVNNFINTVVRSVEGVLRTSVTLGIEPIRNEN